MTDTVSKTEVSYALIRIARAIGDKRRRVPLEKFTDRVESRRVRRIGSR